MKTLEKSTEDIFLDHFLEEPENIIHQTNQYDIFKKLPGQRPVIKNHVEKLKQAILEKNLLLCFPITVDEKFFVYNGQHRLEAAKELKIPIRFVIDKSLKPQDAALFNAVGENWSSRNYLDYFCTGENLDYLKLRDFLDEFDLSIARFKFICSPEQKKIFDASFTNGNFRWVEDSEKLGEKITHIENTISFLNEIIILENKYFLKTDAFWKALNSFYSTKDVDYDKFKEKLGVKYQSIRKMSGYKDYLNAFTQIYNWKSKQKI